MVSKRYVDKIDEFIYDKNGTSMPPTLGTLVLVAFFIPVLIVATFTQFNLPYLVPMRNEANDLYFIWHQYPYIAQIPVVAFIASVLGMRFSLMTILLYIIMGLFIWPIYALGGGIGYVKLPFFGYVLGYIPCVVLISFFLKKFNNYKGMFFGGFTGVFSVYLMGFLYGLLLLIFRQTDFSSVYSETLFSVVRKMPYDLLFSFAAILLAKPMRYFFWLMAGNTKKPKKKQKKS